MVYNSEKNKMKDKQFIEKSCRYIRNSPSCAVWDVHNLHSTDSLGLKPDGAEIHNDLKWVSQDIFAA